MNILRRMSTRALVLSIAVLAGVLAATALAMASRGGPAPPRRPLAVAIHNALAARRVPGVTARIGFTDHLFPTGSLAGGSPLISGAAGRLWLGDGRARLELQSDTGDTEIAFDGRSVTVYDVASNTAYRLPLHRHGVGPSPSSHHGSVPSVADIRQALARLGGHLDLSGAIPGDVAGRPAYSVRISPRHSAGLLGAVELAWDAQHGVPLKVAVYSQGDSSPVLALTVTDISFGPVAASDLAVPTAPGTRVVTVRPPSKRAAHPVVRSAATGAAAVARAVPFRLAAPATLVGVPRKDVRLVKWAGAPAAVAVYGRGLGAMVLLEQRATPAERSPLASLPAVSIDGAPGHELATALGTLVQFDRGGVRYSLIGSLPAAAAEAAARAVG